MQVTLRVILVSGIGVLFQCGCVFAVPVALHHIISKDLVDTEEYFSISKNRGEDKNNELNVISQLDQLYHDNPANQVISAGRPHQLKELKETAYLLVKTIRQRDKRYISYLTLCHFKICNMGRKRTTRYFHMIRELDKD